MSSETRHLIILGTKLIWLGKLFTGHRAIMSGFEVTSMILTSCQTHSICCFALLPLQRTPDKCRMLP